MRLLKTFLSNHFYSLIYDLNPPRDLGNIIILNYIKFFINKKNC